MRKAAVFILIVAAFVGYLVSRQPADPPASSAPGSASTSPPLALPAAPAPMSVVTTPAAAAALDPRILEAADEIGVRITAYRLNGKEAEIEVQWTSDNPVLGTDLILKLVLDGVARDFDLVGEPLRQTYTSTGQRIRSATFKLYLY